ncbi:hypothetical protein M501DRAFT_996429 [Patellaria atrata CBS 101060]|uniref:Uncharacterized protein n=1 Tax=Patellaria atrata CBS 101060 TaxID=1346257 RepID=A0A9P4S5X7_9PEZI|nr:hypothetical protein M501DRAFT_996429 [Patellaria atrata CBS 101060]
MGSTLEFSTLVLAILTLFFQSPTRMLGVDANLLNTVIMRVDPVFCFLELISLATSVLVLQYLKFPLSKSLQLLHTRRASGIDHHGTVHDTLGDHLCWISRGLVIFVSMSYTILLALGSSPWVMGCIMVYVTTFFANELLVLSGTLGDLHDGDGEVDWERIQDGEKSLDELDTLCRYLSVLYHVPLIFFAF